MGGSFCGIIEPQLRGAWLLRRTYYKSLLSHSRKGCQKTKITPRPPPPLDRVSGRVKRGGFLWYNLVRGVFTSERAIATASGSFLCYNITNGGAIGNYHAKAQKILWGEIMFSGLQPVQLDPIFRGCVKTIVFDQVDNSGNYKDLTNKRLFLTAKTTPWDMDADDSDAVFKVEGTIPDPTAEPGRVVFTLSEENTYQDPNIIPYFFDIIATDSDGTSNAEMMAYGTFNIVGHPNNAEAGGE